MKGISTLDAHWYLLISQCLAVANLNLLCYINLFLLNV